MKVPWADTPGWEYDLLRALPPDTAWEVWARARERSDSRLMRSRLGVLTVLPVGLFGLVSVPLIWAAAGWLGWGPNGRMVLEVGFHWVVFRALYRTVERRLSEFRRPFVRDELIAFARTEPRLDGVAELLGQL